MLKVIPNKVLEEFRVWKHTGLHPVLHYILNERGIADRELDELIRSRAGAEWNKIPYRELMIIILLFTADQFENAIRLERQKLRESLPESWR